MQTIVGIPAIPAIGNSERTGGYADDKARPKVSNICGLIAWPRFPRRSLP